MNKAKRFGLLALAGWLLGGHPVAGEEPQWALATRMTGDRLARHVGDLLSVVIEETSSAKLDAKQSTDKSTDIGGSASMGHPSVDGKGMTWTNASLPSFSATASRKFSGAGSMENKGVLSGSVSVRVTDVLPGGQLLIEGTRTLVMQKETLTFTVMGTVRQEDIGVDNSVQSSRVGDLTIRYESRGSIAATQKKGIFDKVIDWINPF